MSYCSNCGKELTGGAVCSVCGAPVEDENERLAESGTPESAPRAATPSGEILLGSDGVYRWVYDLDLFKNPIIVLMLLKIFAFIVLGMFVFVTLISAGDRNFWFEGFLEQARVFGLLLLGMSALVLVGYLVYAAIVGGKYCVLFEMDEDGVKHIQLPKQLEKARVIGMLTALSGAAGGRLGTVGAGLLAASKSSSSSEFEAVRSVYCYPRRNVIKVNQLLSKNQVYCADEDFGFVRDYIVTRCVNAKRIKG